MKEYTIWFVDFFDTLMFRKVHPFQVYERWAYLLSQWLGILELKSTLYSLRQKAIKELEEKGEEETWEGLYQLVYSYLDLDIQRKIEKKSFIDICHRLELNCEIGVQYPHKDLLSRIDKHKKAGGRVFIVSDFHLDSKDLKCFLKAKHIDFDKYFDGIYVSADCGCSKLNGLLYERILSELNIEADNVLMIGDNVISDGHNAEKHGIHSKVEKNIIHKIPGQIRRRLGIDYSKGSFRHIENLCRKFNAPFMEYSLIFYYFSRGLRDRIVNKGASCVSFLSREGYYLKKCYETVLSITPYSLAHNLKTNYVMCSRRSCQSANIDLLNDLVEQVISIHDYLMAYGYDESEINAIAKKYSISLDELNRQEEILKNSFTYQRLESDNTFSSMLIKKGEQSKNAFYKYLNSFDADDVMNIVDIGGRGSMQEAIGDSLKRKTAGYYVLLEDSKYLKDNKEGVLFFTSPDRKKCSQYSDILRANIQLYEQLTAAPHGSPLGYIINDNNEIEVKTDWAANEKWLYENYIVFEQEEMDLVLRGITAWCGGYNEQCLKRKAAKMVLHSSLIANKERLEFLRVLDQGFIQNFNSQTKGLKYNRGDMNISLDIIYAPERYVRYFAKIQRFITNPILKVVYIPFAWLLYAYIWFIVSIKNLF